MQRVQAVLHATRSHAGRLPGARCSPVEVIGRDPHPARYRRWRCRPSSERATVMAAWICLTCGVQHQDTNEPPERCVICADERQYVGWEGQRWTTMAELGRGHTVDL